MPLEKKNQMVYLRGILIDIQLGVKERRGASGVSRGYTSPQNHELQAFRARPIMVAKGPPLAIEKPQGLGTTIVRPW